jgi:aspartate aminotransferase-like enzyme
LVVSNGEFGERLADQARRQRLRFEHLSFDWGAPLDLELVRAKLSGGNPPAWLWTTHCETSTSVLNDLVALQRCCSEYGVKLCLDAMSSIGTMPVDLSGVYLTTCASGKGLRSYAGVAMVFYNHPLTAAEDRLPRYLDLGYYAEQDGIPFTFSSNLIYALQAAVRGVAWPKRYAELVETSAWLRTRLMASGFELVGNQTQTSPAVITLALPEAVDSVIIGNLMKESGFLLSYNSQYLRAKNWIQICLMGEIAREKVLALANALERITRRQPVAEKA